MILDNQFGIHLCTWLILLFSACSSLFKDGSLRVHPLTLGCQLVLFRQLCCWVLIGTASLSKLEGTISQQIALSSRFYNLSEPSPLMLEYWLHEKFVYWSINWGWIPKCQFFSFWLVLAIYIIVFCCKASLMRAKSYTFLWPWDKHLEWT